MAGLLRGGENSGPLRIFLFFILLLFENKRYFTKDDISKHQYCQKKVVKIRFWLFKKKGGGVRP